MASTSSGRTPASARLSAATPPFAFPAPASTRTFLPFHFTRNADVNSVTFPPGTNAAISFGVLAVLYVGPYYAITLAGFYQSIKRDGLAAGTIDPALILGVVRDAGAPVIAETHADIGPDVAWLRAQLG